MVSNASDDFPLPLGPVTTVNFPSGRSTSIPLRLFWRAPRISTHPISAGALTHSFSTAFEPTGNNSRCGQHLQPAEFNPGRVISITALDGSPFTVHLSHLRKRACHAVGLGE